MTKQEVIELVKQLSENQLKELTKFIENIILKEDEDSDPIEDAEQQNLLNLLNYTIESGREDFAKEHNYYLYGIPKNEK